MELISLIVRVKMAKRFVQMPPRDFYENVVMPTLLIILPSLLLCLIPHFGVKLLEVRLFLTVLVYVIVFTSLSWKVAFDYKQKQQILVRTRKWMRR